MPRLGPVRSLGLTGLFEELLDFLGKCGIGLAIGGFEFCGVVDKFNCSHLVTSW